MICGKHSSASVLGLLLVFAIFIQGSNSMDWGWKPWDGPVEKFFLMYLQQMTGKMGDWMMGGRTEDCYQQKEDSQCPCLKDPATELSSGLTLTPVPTNISGVQCPMTFNVACADSSLLVMETNIDGTVFVFPGPVGAFICEPTTRYIYDPAMVKLVKSFSCSSNTSASNPNATEPADLCSCKSSATQFGDGVKVVDGGQNGTNGCPTFNVSCTDSSKQLVQHNIDGSKNVVVGGVVGRNTLSGLICDAYTDLLFDNGFKTLISSFSCETNADQFVYSNTTTNDNYRNVQPCNEVCSTGGDVGTCCRAHGFSNGGRCNNVCNYANPCAMCQGGPVMTTASNEPLCDVICGTSTGGDIMTCCRDRRHQDGFCDFASAKCA